MNNSSRRRFVAGALALSTPGTGAWAASPAPAAPGRDVGRKFHPDGTVKPFGGNTFVGHLGQQGEDFAVFDALLNIYREAPAHDFASKITLTPPNSYHVTVFGGLNDEDQGGPRWPRQLAPALPVDAITQLWLRQLRARAPLTERAFEFEIVMPKAIRDGAPNLPLRPADDATARRLAALRHDLSAFTGIRDKNHDSYQYHMTFGYIQKILTEKEAQSLQAATHRWIEKIPSQGRRIRIPAVHFCSLKDMFAFRELHRL